MSRSIDITFWIVYCTVNYKWEEYMKWIERAEQEHVDKTFSKIKYNGGSNYKITIQQYIVIIKYVGGVVSVTQWDIKIKCQLKSQLF